MNQKRGGLVKVGITVLVLIFLVGVFFYTKKCDGLACFNNYLERCNKARFVNDAKDSIWGYSIKGVKNDKCVVNVVLITVKEGSSDLVALENQEMDCYLNFGEVVDPKKDLDKCHGELREGIQDIMIQKMHAYIMQNVGKISEELSRVI